MPLEHRTICKIVEPNSKVLDLGCGSGDLLYMLKQKKNVKGTGIDISPDGVHECITKGLAIIQGDLEEMIHNYSDNAFDYCILSQTLHQLRQSELVLDEMMRISKEAIIAFYNIAEIKHRLKILFTGRFPRAKNLPYKWLTTNIMFLSANDFQDYCKSKNICIVEKHYYLREKQIKFLPNLRAELCIFKIAKRNHC